MNFAEMIEEQQRKDAEHKQQREDEISELRKSIMAGKITDIDVSEEQELPAVYRDMGQQLVDAINFMNEVKAKIELMKQSLLQAMESGSAKKWEGKLMTITYCEPSMRQIVDVARLKKERPDIYDEYTKISETNPSIRITIKK
jgi:beta-phosphoglucomutase-like phosphatase (HAD superfamily)